MNKALILVFLVMPALLLIMGNGGKLMSYAEEDELEADDMADDDEQAVVEGDAEGEESDGDDLSESTTSAYANTYLLFTKPLYSSGNQLDLPGGVPVEFLIGFQNNAEELDFVVETVEASFRYPMDFNYFIQNFSGIAYNREVKPGHEATVSYSFLPSDAFSGRPFGLNILLSYRDSNGAQYSDSIFNETVTISEVDEGLDGETFFLYLFLGGILVLLAVVGHQFVSGGAGKRKRGGTTQRKVIEVGTNSNDVDYDWLPDEIKKSLQKSPNSKLSPKNTPGSAKQSPKSIQQSSPRLRKTKRTAGSDD